MKKLTFGLILIALLFYSCNDYKYMCDFYDRIYPDSIMSNEAKYWNKKDPNDTTWNFIDIYIIRISDTSVMFTKDQVVADSICEKHGIKETKMW